MVGSADFGVRNPAVSGMFFDDIAGLGTELPGLLAELKWSPTEVDDWNAAANVTVGRARALMLGLRKYNWQMLAEMGAPTKELCLLGTKAPLSPEVAGFAGMRSLCDAAAPAVQKLPWLQHVYTGRGNDASQSNCWAKGCAVGKPGENATSPSCSSATWHQQCAAAGVRCQVSTPPPS